MDGYERRNISLYNTLWSPEQAPGKILKPMSKGLNQWNG
jgi:hypothetical protein